MRSCEKNYVSIFLLLSNVNIFIFNKLWQHTQITNIFQLDNIFCNFRLFLKTTRGKMSKILGKKSNRSHLLFYFLFFFFLGGYFIFMESTCTQFEFHYTRNNKFFALFRQLMGSSLKLFRAFILVERKIKHFFA